jgi:Sec-independent protein translocase protein TatA
LKAPQVPAVKEFKKAVDEAVKQQQQQKQQKQQGQGRVGHSIVFLTVADPTAR